MAAQEINNRSDLLPDASLVVARVSISMAALGLARTYDTAVTLCDSGGFKAFVGQMTSASTMALALVCPQYYITTSTAASGLLSDKIKYPLFFRYASSFEQFIKASVAEYKYFGWTKLGLVTAQTGIYPTLIPTFVSYYKLHGVQIYASVYFPDYNPSISTMYYPQLRRTFEFLASTKLRVFVASMDPRQVIDMMMAANRTGLVGKDYDLLRSVSFVQNLRGPFPNDPFYQSWSPRFGAFLQHTLAYETSLYADMNVSETNPFKQSYPGSFFFANPGTNTIPSTTVLGGYDSLWAIARTFEKIISDSGSSAQGIANNTLAPKFSLDTIISTVAAYPCISGSNILTPQGDLSPNPIFNFQMNGSSFGAESAVNSSVLPYNFSTDTSSFVPDQSKFIWPGNRTFFDFPIDFPPVINDFVSWSSTAVRVVLAICAMSALVCVVASHLLFAKARRSQIAFSAPRNLALTCIGLALISICPFTLVGMERPFACHIRLWLISIGLALVLSCAFVMNLQIVRIVAIYDQSIPRAINALKSWMNRAFVIGSLVLAIIPLAVATALNAITSEAVYVEASDKYMWVCKTQTTAELALWIVGTILALLLALLVLAAYLSRHAPEIVNNSKQVGLSVLIVIILSTTSLLQSYKATSTGVQFYIEAASCIGGVVAVFGLLVFPRMLEYLSFGTKKNKQKTKTINRKRRSSSQSSASANITANIKPADDSVIAELRKQHNVFTAQALVRLGNIMPQWRTATVAIIPAPIVACITLLKLARFPIKEAQFALVKDMTSARASKIASDRTAICEMQFGHHRIHVQFCNLPKMHAWIDALGRTLKQVHAKNREAENEDAGSTDIKIITEIAVSRK
ncbi:hypothetical protein HK105_204039 [Polyrhizophydium stewartii]|uniref:G-protein coupled receptors family 3 profile domain-containing protein n=1 Tax=Polyrhizophydium stewartii TaxID=2732419 RepID=A0ABR4N9T3_9FUNG